MSYSEDQIVTWLFCCGSTEDLGHRVNCSGVNPVKNDIFDGVIVFPQKEVEK